MANYGERIHSKIFDFYYKTKDIEKVKALCVALLESKTEKSDKNFKGTVHGEVCETLLEIMLKDYITKNNLDWVVAKGIVLKNLETPDSNYLTEVDLIVATPFKVLTFECKSYGGNKTLTKECTINRPNIKPFDLYRQHEKHLIALHTNIKKFRYKTEQAKKYSPYTAVYFDLSIGSLKDNREDIWRRRVPALNKDTLYKYLDTFRDKPVCWDLPKVKRVIDILEKSKSNNRKKHLEYVKSLHKN